MKLLSIRAHFLSGSLSLVMAAVCLAGTGRPAPAEPESPALTAMELELKRSMDGLSKADPPAYFISYTITDEDRAEVMGSNGALLSSDEARNRVLETQVRVGGYELDNTHKVGERQSNYSSSASLVTIQDDVPVLRRSIWLATDRQYRSAAEAYIRIKTGKQVEVESAESRAPDFSQEAPHDYSGKLASLQVDRRPWEARVRLYTRTLSSSPSVMNSIATFTAAAQNEFLVNSEGTRIAFGELRYRLELYVQAKASDGMDINRYANFDWLEPSEAPTDKVVLESVHRMIQEVEALQKAPLLDPYAGPAMLSGRAAAVFFHEVFGHRVEGFRQKDISEGQTFTAKVGEKIMPDFISIYDDPTQQRMGSEVLLGYYPYDDEGVPAEHVSLVDHGVLKNFLMSRSPLVGFPQSNGHGRRQIGFQSVSRQGNLVVVSDKKVSSAELRRMLVEQIRRQGKPFGLFIDDIAGGFTFTGRGLPQAFQVQPLIVYKVFPDGRPDELVRGVDILGTPLISLTKIVATSDREEVFNGFCGAESGSVPVAAVAPAILISELEVQKKETSTDKPPILPPPAHDPLANRSKP